MSLLHNEAVTKGLCHNLCVVIQYMYKLEVVHQFELRRRRSLILAQGWSAATTLGLDHKIVIEP